MKSQRQMVFRIAVVAMILGLAGCSGKSKANLEAANAKKELAIVKTQMQAMVTQLTSERDALATQVKTMTSEMEKLKTDLAAAIKDQDGFKEQIQKLTGDQSVADAQKKYQSIIDDLKKQLADLTGKFTALQGDNSKLQATIKDLQEKLKGVGGNLIPKLP